MVPVAFLQMVYQGWRLSWCIWLRPQEVATILRNRGVLTVRLVPGPAQQALPLIADAPHLVHLLPIYSESVVLTQALCCAADMVDKVVFC